MFRRAGLAALLIVLSLSSSAVQAADPCPCVPVSHLWTVKSCDTWQCASDALADASGDPNVFVMPSSSEQHRWLVLRRVTAGTAAEAADSSFVIEQFPKMIDGSVRFDSIDGQLEPMMVTTYDHAVLVIYLKDAPVRRRSAGH